MQPNSWHHKLFYFTWHFEFGKCGKEWKKLKKMNEYLENDKSLEIKSDVHSFWRVIIWWKSKTAATSLKSERKIAEFKYFNIHLCNFYTLFLLDKLLIKQHTIKKSFNEMK